MSAVIQLTPQETYEFVTNALACRQVAYIAGPPAIGKSQVVHQIAKDANAKMIDLRLSQILSEDMTGLPERDDKRGKAVYLPFETFPLEDDPIPENYSGWLLFLDELSSATEEVLAASYSLILDRTVGGKKLHPKCLVVAAGNRATDSAIARELPDTLITRMLPCEMKVSTKDWLTWANEPHVNSNEAVVGFITKHPNMLYAPTKAKEREELETFATPRGWEKVFKHIDIHEKRTGKEEEVMDSAGVPTGKKIMAASPISDGIYHLMSAAVGSMAARAFREEYDEQIQLPFAWEIAQSPSSIRIPSTGIGKTNLINDLANYFLESGNQSRDSILIYVNRIGGEYSEMFLHQIKNGLGNSPTDKKLVDNTAKRLSIDPLLGTAPQQGGADSNSQTTF